MHRQNFKQKQNKNNKLRSEFIKFKSSTHKHNIKRGKYSGIPSEKRFCEYCTNAGIHLKMHEYHFLMICPKYKFIRETYIPKYCYNTPSMF